MTFLKKMLGAVAIVAMALLLAAIALVTSVLGLGCLMLYFPGGYVMTWLLVVFVSCAAVLYGMFLAVQHKLEEWRDGPIRAP